MNISQYDLKLEKLIRLCRNDVSIFTQTVLKELESPMFMEEWVYAMHDTYKEVTQSSIKHRALINIRSRIGKSTMFTIFVSAYHLGKHPNQRICVSTSSNELLRNMVNGASATTLIEIFNTKIFKLCFPDFGIVKDVLSQSRILTTSKGEFSIKKSGSNAIGGGYHLIIFDDFYNPNAIESFVKVETATMHLLNFLTRKQDDPPTKIFVVEQRLHAKHDTTAICLEKWKNSEYIHLILDTKFDEDFEVIINNKIYKWLTGSYLSSRLNAETDKEDIATAGSDARYQAIYRQRPYLSTDTLFKLTRDNYVDPIVIKDQSYDFTIISADCASSSSSTADNTAFVYMGYRRDTATFYVIDVIKGKWEYEQIEEQFRHFYAKCDKLKRVSIVAIEAASSGTSLFSLLNSRSLKHPDTGYSIIPSFATELFKARASKQARCELAAKVSGMRIKLPTHAEWLSSYVSELTSFPHGKNDDMVDATTQGIIVLMEKLDGKRLR